MGSAKVDSQTKFGARSLKRKNNLVPYESVKMPFGA